MTFDLLLIGVVITLEPIPLTAFILILASKRGVRKGAAFIFGWLLSLAAVITITVLITGNNPPQPSTAPSLAGLAIKALIGVGLLIIALRQWRRMGRPKKPKKTPKWQTGIDNMSPWFALSLGVLTQPWGLVGAAAVTVMEAQLSSWQSYVALFAFCIVGTALYIAMEIYAGFWPEHCQEFLGKTRAWIETHTDQVIIVVSLVLGFWLIAKSIFLATTS